MSQTVIKRSYKATFILDTRHYQEPVETLVDLLRKTISGIDAEVRKVENLGQRDFVRVANRKFPVGIYVQIHFDGGPEAPAALKEKLRLERTINRILIEQLEG